MTLDLKHLRELADAATPGPWHHERFFRAGDNPDTPGRFRIFLLGHSNPKTNSRDCDWSIVDAAFIAAARTAVPELLDEVERLRARLAAAGDAARRFVALVDDLGAFADDGDPRVMALAAPIGEAQADLWSALGLDCDAEAAMLHEDIDSRCAVCGWPLVERPDAGCIRGNCSMRPRPWLLYAPARAAKEAK